MTETLYVGGNDAADERPRVTKPPFKDDPQVTLLWEPRGSKVATLRIDSRSRRHRSSVKMPPKVAGLDRLTVPERILFFCVASGTNPAKAGITHRTIELAIIKNLIKREPTGLTLTELGGATMNALLSIS
jgi:hypothetical protein